MANLTAEQARKEVVNEITSHPHLLGHYLGYDKLTEMHSEWILDAYTSRDKDFCLQAHRGSYKTTAIAIVGIIWWLFFNWNDRMLILRKDFSKASEILQIITRQLKSEKFRKLFKFIYNSEYTITVDTQARVSWSLKETMTPEANINAFGIGQDLTGNHFDKALCDDFVSLKDRISRAERDRTITFINDLRANILDPGTFGIYTGTPWHERDAWTLFKDISKYSIHDTQLDAFTKEHIAYLRQIQPASLFAANYELKHIADEEALFSEPVIGKWIGEGRAVGHIDAKYQGRDTGAFTILERRFDGSVQGYGYIFYKHINEEYDKLMEIWRKYQCGTVHVESNADKGYAARDLSQLGMLTSQYHERENKHIKILQNLTNNWERIEWCEETDPEYLAQIVEYREGQEPDDCPDSLASLIRESGIFKTNPIAIYVEEYGDEY